MTDRFFPGESIEREQNGLKIHNWRPLQLLKQAEQSRRIRLLSMDFPFHADQPTITFHNIAWCNTLGSA